MQDKFFKDSQSFVIPKSNAPLLITTGEPAGIGMDIVIDILVNHNQDLSERLIVLADERAFYDRANALLKQGKIRQLPNYQKIDVEKTDQMDFSDIAAKVSVIHLPCTTAVQAGCLSVDNASMVERQLNLAHQWAMQGKVAAIVTAPIQKSVMIDAGIRLKNGEMFSGHTEFFMHQANCHKVVMMLANAAMKVALVTTHLPLKEVAKHITTTQVEQTLKITYQALRRQFGIANPKILVCGLNPHAGEDGHLGDEEQTTINPVLKKLQNQGMNVSLAMPADTLFTPRHLKDADAVVAMYHDQGLAPLKSHGFGETVNITLGLPYIRTSVDHGTALDLAATARASSQSLLHAIWQANSMMKAMRATL